MFISSVREVLKGEGVGDDDNMDVYVFLGEFMYGILEECVVVIVVVRCNSCFFFELGFEYD